MFILYNHHRARPCRKNRYDQQDEYLVVVKEHGQREQEESQEELRRSSEKLEAAILLVNLFPIFGPLRMISIGYTSKHS